MKRVIALFLLIAFLFVPIAIWALQKDGTIKAFDFWGYLENLSQSAEYTFGDLTQSIAGIWKDQKTDEDSTMLQNLSRTMRKISDTLYEIGQYLSSLLQLVGAVTPWLYTVDITNDFYVWGRYNGHNSFACCCGSAHYKNMAHLSN